MNSSVKNYLEYYKYELLLFALIQHLFIGIFLSDLIFYRDVIWPINMVFLGIASIGVFIEKGFWKNVVRNILFAIVVALPLGLQFFGHLPYYFLAICLMYTFYFAFIFNEIIRFLVRPSYINVDIIFASACGYFLLIEISVFILQYLFYLNPLSFKGVDHTNHTSVYIDMVYFCSITITSIGFGDILPNAHYTKLIVAFLGIVGQFYSVVLVGIMISKFTNRER